jgi:uncharacterized RDD family membrane protein YckC
MTTKQIPLTIDGLHESLYAGFWIRFGSLLLDILIIMPVVFIFLYLNGLSKNACFYTVIPFLIFHFWYNIYLVQKNGGTPGKLISGITILKTDGTDLTWREAILRHIVSFSLTIFISIITIIALSQSDTEYYESLNWMKKQQYLMTLLPVYFSVNTWASNIWTYSELFVLLFNKRKRALHDFIAETVIVRTKYIYRIRAAMNPVENE